MPIPKVSEPIAGQWPVSVSWRAYLESLDSRLAVLANAGTPEVTIPAAGRLVPGEGVTLYGSIDYGQVATVSLALYPDSGVGAGLVKITRDQYGRVEGTESVTPADMLNPFATYLVDESGDYLTDADGNFLVSDDGTLVQDSITNGVTDKAPSQNAVFDALAGKLDDSGGATTGSYNFSGTLYVDSANGRVGLGVATPARQYHLVGLDGPVASFPSAVGPRNHMVMENNGNCNFAFVANGDSGFFIYKSGAASASGSFQYSTVTDAINMRTAGVNRFTVDSAGAMTPGADNAQPLGSASLRWQEIFCANATINTSDAREKTAPRDLTSAEIGAALDIARLPCLFQWLHAIEAKGEGARLHASPTVQSVMAAMQAHGLDPFRYGFVCYDQWGETQEVRDEESGEVVQGHRQAGDRYSLRQGELTAFIMRALVKRQDDIEARLAALGG